MLTHVTTATVMIPAMREFHFAVATEEPDAANTAYNEVAPSRLIKHRIYKIGSRNSAIVAWDS